MKSPLRCLRLRILKEAYRRIMDEYQARIRAFSVQQLPQRVRTFEACKGPLAEVRCDPSLFLGKYFLDEDGDPDKTKTSELILLSGYLDRHMALKGRTERVPGLHVAEGGLRDAETVTVIGWSRGSVNEKAHQIDLEKSNGRGVLRSAQNWDQQMRRHHDYAQRLNAHDFFESHHTLGIYAIKCEYM